MSRFHPCIVGLVLVAAITGCAMAADPAPILLGTAGNFAFLPELVYPTSQIPLSVEMLNVSEQFWTSAQVNGRLMGATDGLPTPALLTVAVLDMQAAFTDAMNRPGPNFVGMNDGRIGGSILAPGIYKWTTGVTVAEGITISGSSTDTWIFQISGSFNQAQECHCHSRWWCSSPKFFWAIAGTVTVGANAIFQGNILAKKQYSCAPKGDDRSVLKRFRSSSPELFCPANLSTFSPQCTLAATPCITVEFQGLNASIREMTSSPLLSPILLKSALTYVLAFPEMRICKSELGQYEEHDDVDMLVLRRVPHR
ncbi:hypothetical protein B0H13DRAFT_2673501 [Mycena leptocephala]|nr:hypothetical protein B0H13DRAFT_2673501 [Mycena leptocephala]